MKREADSFDLNDRSGAVRLAPLAMALAAAALKFYVPVSVLFLRERGQSLSDIFIFESVLLCSILLTEIPIGLIADRVDRRWIIIAGFTLNAAAEIVFASGVSFSWFVVSFSLSGFGISMLTGTQDAYIYDELGDTADAVAVRVWGRLSAIQLLAGVAGSIVGGLLATIDVSWAAIAAAISATLGVICVLFLKRQPPTYFNESTPEESTLTSLVAGVKLLFGHPILLYVVFASSASFVLFNSVFTLNQPRFESGNVPVAIWGFLGGGAQLVAAGYNHFAGKIEIAVGRKFGLFLAMSYGGVGFILMSIPHLFTVILGFCLVVVGLNSRGPITSAVANKIIPSHRRATVLNIASSAGSLVGVGLNPAIGFGAEANSSVTAIGLGVVILILAISWIPIADRFLNASE